jgi:oxygen-independent coproporphyrinogen-3 oxidase
MDKELIDKYNVSVPRYTSYPPANYFKDFDQEQYLEAVAESNHAQNNNLSF